MRKFLTLVAAALPFMLLWAPANAAIELRLGTVEHTCVLPIPTFPPEEACSFSGAANINADLSAGAWVGPLDSGGFYSSLGTAPAFVFSTQTGVDADGVPISDYLTNFGSVPGDGKSQPTITSNITITRTGPTATEATVGGSFTINDGARFLSTGSATIAGPIGAVEEWAGITHNLVAHPGQDLSVDAASGNCGAGGMLDCVYVVGSQGFPGDATPILATGAPFNNTFGFSELPVDLAATSPWTVANGGSGPQGAINEQIGIIDIVSYQNPVAGFGLGALANFGVQTSVNPETDVTGYSCTDTGIQPREAGDAVGFDPASDCVDSAAVWGSNKIDPVDGPAGDPDRSNFAFDNLLMKITTDVSGEVTDVSAYYVLQYDIISAGYNSWVGGVFSSTVAAVPVPAAVWLFGSALGLLGWIRRRVTIS